jgi:hypothetical protein
MNKATLSIAFLVLLIVVIFLVLNGAHIIFTVMYIYYSVIRTLAVIGVVALAAMGYKLFFAKKN